MATTTQAAPPPKPDINFAKVQSTTLDKYIAKHKVKVHPKDDVKTRAVKLQAWYRGVIKADALAHCDNCGGDSDPVEPECPFCGVAGVTEEETTAPKDEKKGELLKGASVSTKPGAEKVVPIKANGAAPANGNALATTKPAAIEAVDMTAQLDTAVAHVHKLRADMQANAWDLGHALRQLFESNLYKERRGADGKAKYKTWSQFVHDEFQWSHRYSFLLMDVAKAYPREMVAKFGPTKLYLALTAPPDTQKEIEEKIKEGASRSELREHADRVQQLTGNADVKPERDTGRGGFRKGKEKVANPKKSKAAEKGKAARAALPEGSVAVVLSAKRLTVPLYKRATEGARATRIADDPWGQIPLADGQQMHFRVTKTPSGDWKLIVEVTS